jgi:predicted HicB family RNase H-like nuclease
MLKYKGYTGYVVFDDEARIFHGEVAAIKAVITFQGTTVDEIEQAFKDSVDDYLDWCKERGKEPEKPYSGKLNLRMPPDLYVKVVAQAAQEGLSINSYILRRLSA